MCSMINSYAFIMYKEDFKSFFSTPSDAICSTITFIYSALVLFFPYFSWMLIHRFQGCPRHDKEDFLEILMEGINPHSYQASMYTVYFILRRLATGIILVSLVDWPFFACAFLMIFSTINFFYITIVKPFATRNDNIIEAFNEITIYICSQIYTVLCRSEGGHVTITKMGWSFITTCSFNILINVALLIINSCVDLV